MRHSEGFQAINVQFGVCVFIVFKYSIGKQYFHNLMMMMMIVIMLKMLMMVVVVMMVLMTTINQVPSQQWKSASLNWLQLVLFLVLLSYTAFLLHLFVFVLSVVVIDAVCGVLSLTTEERIVTMARRFCLYLPVLFLPGVHLPVCTVTSHWLFLPWIYMPEFGVTSHVVDPVTLFIRALAFCYVTYPQPCEQWLMFQNIIWCMKVLIDVSKC